MRSPAGELPAVDGLAILGNSHEYQLSDDLQMQIRRISGPPKYMGKSTLDDPPFRMTARYGSRRDGVALFADTLGPGILDDGAERKRVLDALEGLYPGEADVRSSAAEAFEDLARQYEGELLRVDNALKQWLEATVEAVFDPESQEWRVHLRAAEKSRKPLREFTVVLSGNDLSRSTPHAKTFGALEGYLPVEAISKGGHTGDGHVRLRWRVLRRVWQEMAAES